MQTQNLGSSRPSSPVSSTLESFMAQELIDRENTLTDSPNFHPQLVENHQETDSVLGHNLQNIIEAAISKSQTAVLTEQVLPYLKDVTDRFICELNGERQTLTAAHQESVSLNQENATLNQESAALNQENATLNQENAALKESLDAEIKKIATLEQDLKTRNKKIEILEREIENNKRSREEQIQAGKKQRIALKQEIEAKILPRMKAIEWDDRVKAIHALNALPEWPVDIEQHPNLAALFKDSRWPVKQHAILFLGPRLSKENLNEYVTPLLRDKTWQVQKAAVRVLGQHLSQKQLDLKQPIAFSKHPAWDAHEGAIYALGHHPSPEPLDLEPFITPLTHKAWEPREEAVYVLGQYLPAERLVQKVMPRLKDDCWQVRYAAILVFYLRTSAEQSEMRISAERLAQEVMWLETDSSWELQEVLADILGKLNVLSPQAKEVLIRLAQKERHYHDPDENVRRAATSALNKHAISV